MGRFNSIMPFARASFRALGTLGPALRRLARIASIAVVAGFALFALALLAVRFIVFPRIETYRDTLTATLATQLGQPVEIASLTTGWDGWNPKLVIGGLRVQDRARASDVPLLLLPEVDLIVAWTSLPLLELRLKQLIIERPRLAIRRDRAGMLHLAGLEFNPAQAADDLPITDWLLRQRQIVIRDALVTWNDDSRNAPQLVLDRVQFRLENRFGRHRFGIAGTPPADLAAPIDIRGDVQGGSLKEWQKARGQVYVRLDYADVEAWREWLPLPPEIVGGKGALRVWFDFAAGEPREMVADLELANVKARLGDDLPELALAHLSGRVGWRNALPLREVFARDLAFVTATGATLEASNFTFSMREPAAGNTAGGQFEFDRMQLQPLRELAAFLPLPARWRTDLARFAPRGTLSRGRLRWEGTPEAATSFSASTEFTDLGILAQDTFPGASGVSGSVDATEKGGELKLATRNAALDLPRVFAGPIPLDGLQGAVRWERIGERTRVDIQRLEFANAHVAGNVGGTYRTSVQGPGEIDLTAQLSRGDPREVYRYLPHVAHEATRDWLHRALTKGEVTDARLKLAGDLAHFPFADGKGGQFIVTAKARGVTLDFADHWPPIEAIDGELRFEGATMTIDAARGRVFETQIGRTRAAIADVRAVPPHLVVEGSATGPLPDYLRFIAESPVDAITGHITEGAEGNGTGQLTLNLDLALGKRDGHKIGGEFAFANTQLKVPGVPRLSQLNGKFGFENGDMRARELTAEVAGGPAKFAIATADGRIRLTGGGTANLASLRREYASPLAARLTGVTDWIVVADVRGERTTFVLESALKGAVVDLPVPLGKAAGDPVPIRLEMREDSAHPDEDTVDAAYGRALYVTAHRKQQGSDMRVDRALVALGNAATHTEPLRAERPGIWVRGDLPVLNVDDWLSLRERENAAAGPNAGDDDGPLLGGVDIDVGTLEVFGRRFNEFKVVARRSRDDWKLDLRGQDLAGTAAWSAPGGAAPSGRIVARLSRFAMPGAGDLPAWSGAEKASDAKAAQGTIEHWPELDIAADSFVSKGRDLGQLELVAQPRGGEWRIEKLVLSNDAGRIDASGAWRNVGRQQQTKLDASFDTKDAGAFLGRMGYPDAIKGAPTTIRGQLAWSGSPTEFDYPTLTGTLRLDAGPGRFTKIDPGIGKLLGVLSLQSLPRRMTFDFQDVFSEGFAFDQITGDVRITNGVMSADDLRLVGPAAKVDIAGDADLAKETQRLTVHVQPSLSSSVSAGAALLFFANPLVGAAVGAGSLLAQSALKDPIEQIFSYQYTVTGGWSDPVVTRVGTATASAGRGPLMEGMTR
jgi:uncharacterized protein (TIGR02099 family)